MNIQDFINEVRAQLRETDIAAHRYVHPVWGESNRDFGPVGNPTFEKPEANSLLDLRDSTDLKTALEIIEALMPLVEATEFNMREWEAVTGGYPSLTAWQKSRNALKTMREKLEKLK